MSYPFNQIPSTNPQNIGVPTPVGLQTAARDPTPLDNTYVPGSEWQNSVTKAFWKCVSSTVPGAVWTKFVPAGGGGLTTLTGNSGGAVSPDGSQNINVIGDNLGILIAGNPGTNTLTASLKGGGIATQSFATDLNGPVVPTSAGVLNLTGSSTTFTNGSVANTVRTEVQGADHALFIGNGSNVAAGTLAVGTNGQVLIAATGNDPAFATITSPDGSITFTTGANSLAMTVTGGATVGQTLTGDSGGARPPTAGNWNIIGGTVLAGTSPLKTAGAGSTITINAQLSQALAAGDATKVGLANFDSSTFAVSAAGFVTLTAGTVGASSFPVNAATAPGTNPVLPTGGGAVSILGTIVPAHTIPIQTDSLVANTINVEVQRASTSATTNATQQGMASFNSGQFTSDANGWITGNSGSASFLAYLPSIDSNVTGAGAVYYMGTNVGLTEEFDIGANFTPGPVAGGSFFTAPATGIYHFDIAFALGGGIAAGMVNGTALLNINGGTRFYSGQSLNPLACSSGGAGLLMTGSFNVNLTAADIVRAGIVVQGGGANSVDLAALLGASRQSWWSGYRIS